MMLNTQCVPHVHMHKQSESVHAYGHVYRLIAVVQDDTETSLALCADATARSILPGWGRAGGQRTGAGAGAGQVVPAMSASTHSIHMPVSLHRHMLYTHKRLHDDRRRWTHIEQSKTGQMLLTWSRFLPSCTSLL